MPSKEEKKKIATIGDATIKELKKVLIDEHRIDNSTLKKVEYKYEHLVGAKRYKAIIQEFSHMIYFFNKVKEKVESKLNLKTVAEELIQRGDKRE